MSSFKETPRPAVFQPLEAGFRRETEGVTATTRPDRDFHPYFVCVRAGSGLCGQDGQKDYREDSSCVEADGREAAASPGIPPEKDERGRRIEEAQREAARILDEARQKAEETENKAYELGFAQGRKDGEEMGRRQYEAKAEHLVRVVEEIRKAGESLVAQYEVEIVRLALAAAKAAVRREISLSPDAVITVVRAALAETVAGSPITLHLAPADADRVRDAMATAGDLSADGHPITILPDGSVEPGGCFVETPFGSIDATMEGRWRVISEGIESVMAERLAAASSGLAGEPARAGGAGEAE